MSIENKMICPNCKETINYKGEDKQECECCKKTVYMNPLLLFYDYLLQYSITILSLIVIYGVYIKSEGTMVVPIILMAIILKLKFTKEAEITPKVSLEPIKNPKIEKFNQFFKLNKSKTVELITTTVIMGILFAAGSIYVSKYDETIKNKNIILIKKMPENKAELEDKIDKNIKRYIKINQTEDIKNNEIIFLKPTSQKNRYKMLKMTKYIHLDKKGNISKLDLYDVYKINPGVLIPAKKNMKKVIIENNQAKFGEFSGKEIRVEKKIISGKKLWNNEILIKENMSNELKKKRLYIYEKEDNKIKLERVI